MIFKEVGHWQIIFEDFGRTTSKSCSSVDCCNIIFATWFQGVRRMNSDCFTDPKSVIPGTSVHKAALGLAALQVMSLDLVKQAMYVCLSSTPIGDIH